MTTEIEKQFFETFGIEPSATCKYAKYGYEGTEGTWYFCSKNQKECWTYPSDTTCKDKMTSYPEITDRILLELICILSGYQKAIGSLLEICETNKDGVKEEILEMLIFRDGALKQPVQELFKGNGNAE